MADDLGDECLGAYGSKQYRTPNLDRLAADGVRFDYAFSTPLCTPTRVMLMTGKYNRDRPFFLYWPMGIPHAPFDATPDSADTSVRNDRRMYPDMVAYMDKVVGKLVAAVNELGLAKRTLIIFTADNGTPHGIFSELGGRTLEGGKGSMRDSGTHEPFLARWTGTIPAGTTSRELVTLADIYPTLAELAGVDVSKERLDGTSLLPWMKGEPGEPRDWVFVSYKSQRPNPNTGRHRVSAWVRNHRWKLYDSGQLYDLEHDLDEITPASGTEADAMRKRLQPVFARVGATPEALQRFRDTNVRSSNRKSSAGKKRKP
jgi:arylsulfatase A